MEKKYIIALDQGTTSSRAIIFDHEQNIVEIASQEFEQIFPHPGYVEHNPIDILQSQLTVLDKAVCSSKILWSEVSAIGITNQRETTVVWDKQTGKPIYNAIVWQCRRTAPICERLKKQGLEGYVKQNTGLVIDAYFSATKLVWILENVENAKSLADDGRLLFGTVDTWLIWNLTKGKVFVTDYTNASRTMLFNIKTLEWDKKMCDALNIPMSMLPEVKSSSEIYGYIEKDGIEIPIAGIAGDQQAALFGQICFEKGQAKNTYGTGCFMLLNTGHDIHYSKSGMLTTIAMGLKDEITYAIEGSVFTGGAVVQWLRDEMHLIEKASDTEFFANEVKDNGGVYVVPAFTGLGAPYWDMYAKGLITGITRGTKKEHIIRASLESIAYQSADLIECIEKDTEIELSELKVDGGASANSFLMQFQSDITNKKVRRPIIRETTALGAAYLAGLAVGFWKSKQELKNLWSLDKLYTPKISQEEREKYKKEWKNAIKKALENTEEHK